MDGQDPRPLNPISFLQAFIVQGIHGNVSTVARQIGITPRAVHMKQRAHGIDAASYRVQLRD